MLSGGSLHFFPAGVWPLGKNVGGAGKAEGRTTRGAVVVGSAGARAKKPGGTEGTRSGERGPGSLVDRVFLVARRGAARSGTAG